MGTDRLGKELNSPPYGGSYLFVPLNNDGWEDLYVANGYISQPDTEDL